MKHRVLPVRAVQNMHDGCDAVQAQVNAAHLIAALRKEIENLTVIQKLARFACKQGPGGRGTEDTGKKSETRPLDPFACLSLGMPL
jgi:hypothetical protein